MAGDFWVHAFVYLCAAVIAVPIAKRTGLGSVLGYLIAGVAIGPFGLGLVGNEESEEVLHFAEFGVVMMLFLVGLELEPSKLWRLRKPVLGLGGLQVLFTTALIAGIVWLGFGRSGGESIALGMIVALSSTAIVLQSLAEKGLLKTPAGQNSFAVLLFQDIAVIPMLAILPLLGSGVIETADAHGGSHDAGHGGHGESGGAGQALLVLGTVAALILGGRFLSVPVFRFIAAARLPEIFTAAALLLVVGISLAMHEVGLSPALGTFVAGVVLANNEYRHELEADVEPFKGLLLGLFFLSVGSGIDFDLIVDQPGTIAGLVAGLVVVKLLVLVTLGKVFGMPLRENVLFTFALAQGGEFAFVLGSFAKQNGVLDAEVTGLMIAVVALSMITTPLLLIAEEKLIRPALDRLRPLAPDPDMPTFEETRAALEAARGAEGEHPRVIIAGVGRFGLAVTRLLQTQGQKVTVLDLDPAQIKMLAKFGVQVHYGDASWVDLLHSAGAEEASVFVIAVDDSEKARQMAIEARKHFPHLKILARVRGRREAYEMIRVGVDDVYRETLGTSMDLGITALRALGMRAHEAHRAARLFENYDEQGVREMAEAFGDSDRYVTLARARSAEVERLLADDMRRAGGVVQDDAWDPPGDPTKE